MNSVIVTGFGVMLGKTSERLVVRGPRPRLELVEGGPQLFLPLDLPARPPLQVVTSDGIKSPVPSLRAARAANGDRPAARPKAEQVELPLFRVSEIIVASSGISISTDSSRSAASAAFTCRFSRRAVGLSRCSRRPC
jgi:hypothetical protein